MKGVFTEYKPGETAKNIKIQLNGCDSKLYKFDMCLIAEDCVTGEYIYEYSANPIQNSMKKVMEKIIDDISGK